ncbi:hypothetical protein BDF20DRAFT_832993 [Mycotypha africana]|uniref:uncharacterized protein n=1 Tax=Mycotypha africana TaxID=64632 RepID=UPI002300E1E6|nr:uncharacterized protein BDF20DRAFT_832993 [Mycotypha africana]KAI8988120.1 hypothetical protein BDF20DRAFT_832993 [Mycotypha africana]
MNKKDISSYEFGVVSMNQPMSTILSFTCMNCKEESTAIDRNQLLQHFSSTSPFYKCILSHEYTELLKSICESINIDWLIFPQYRYAISQLFSGAILVEQSSAILRNCVEPYGRLKSTDAHHERRIATAIHFFSYPEKETFRPYNFWTLYEYDTPQNTNSEAKLLSNIFQSIAYSVIRNGPSARVNVNCFKNVKNQLKGNVIKSILAQILELEDEFIMIINNFELSSLLQPLADSMSTSIKVPI